MNKPHEFQGSERGTSGPIALPGVAADTIAPATETDQTFERPAAFIASPIWASPLSMKLAK
jgi:hypothetical protein